VEYFVQSLTISAAFHEEWRERMSNGEIARVCDTPAAGAGDYEAASFDQPQHTDVGFVLLNVIPGSPEPEAIARSQADYRHTTDNVSLGPYVDGRGRLYCVMAQIIFLVAFTPVHLLTLSVIAPIKREQCLRHT